MEFQFCCSYEDLGHLLANTTNRLGSDIEVVGVYLFKDKYTGKRVCTGHIVFLGKPKFNKLKLSRPEELQWLREAHECSLKYMSSNDTILIHEISRNQIANLHFEALRNIDCKNTKMAWRRY